MMNKTMPVGIVLVVLIACGGTGCGGGTSDPLGIIPGTPAAQSDAGGGTNHVLWGVWQCSMEPDSGRIEAVPLRGLNLTANVNTLLEGHPGNLLIQNLDLTDFETEGRLDCTITLRHPFPGIDEFNGFDVWGVFMHNGASALSYDGLTYSGGPNAGANEAILLNPDGCTRWFNFMEFDGDGPAILGYCPGKLSNLPAPVAMLNPFMIFADGLGQHDDYHQWISSPGNADDRGIFRAGGANSRRYELRFPIIGGKPIVDFQYAVIASWEPGDPTLTGHPAVYEPYDFPTSANCDEPFFVDVSTDASELYYAGISDFGGTFSADIEVFDWQGGAVGRLGVVNELEGITIEGDFVPGGSHEFTQVELGAVAMPATENSSVFQVEIVDCVPQASGSADFWVIVESAGLNGESFYQGYPTEYPAQARRAAFLPASVTVSNESMMHMIYVDDSNTSGIEDGTQEHPYNTIQEGVDAAALLEGYEVWVDDSGNPYEEQVNMKSGVIVLSVNWDESDGGNRAFIDGPEDPETYSVLFYNVDDAILDGFRIGFAGPWELPWPFTEGTEMIHIEGGSNITVQDCLFTGDTDRLAVYPVVANGTADLTIANCRIASIDRGANENACANFKAIHAQSCTDLVVCGNLIADIRSTEDETSKEINAIEVTDSAGAVIRNNLIHHIIPHAGVGSMGGVLMKGIYLINSPNAELANNTIDNVDSSDAFSINQVMAFYLEASNGVGFTDNIATRIYSSGFPQPTARGVQGHNCTVVCDYTDTYDIGPGVNGTDYYGGASPGIGAISADPLYIDSDNEQYDVSDVSPAQRGDPSYVDWDDTGPPSNDPDNYDPETRSRMGCHGGPGGEFVGLLTPE